tara:strand:- start:491 stop:730 length:240 start_codon:yes stop_codon:yes gene_type:complete
MIVTTMSETKRTFSTKVRMPYQDAIALILRTIDFHHELMTRNNTNDKERIFHEKQSIRLKAWLVDQKEWIHEKETLEEE